jgi:hypothetical protein
LISLTTILNDVTILVDELGRFRPPLTAASIAPMRGMMLAGIDFRFETLSTNILGTPSCGAAFICMGWFSGRTSIR